MVYTKVYTVCQPILYDSRKQIVFLSKRFTVYTIFENNNFLLVNFIYIQISLSTVNHKDIFM